MTTKCFDWLLGAANTFSNGQGNNMDRTPKFHVFFIKPNPENADLHEHQIFTNFGKWITIGTVWTQGSWICERFNLIPTISHGSIKKKKWQPNFKSKYLLLQLIIPKTKSIMLIYVERTTISISQFKKRRVSNLAPYDGAVMIRDVSWCNSSKQMKEKL